MDWIVHLIQLAPFVMIIFVVWFGTITRRARDRNLAELQKDLLTKFTSADEDSTNTEFMADRESRRPTT